ncbi:hypothetical protein COLO4_36727 [Corchorus olitorius]|uniref:SET domain-containing protein n=1 Tax=Corchorus olitorius TaxID=93759 RepID=A0A1R3G5V0_9ROSI|nr:hypothetical protein COLO4_36727 [Corchorus olitorius]
MMSNMAATQERIAQACAAMANLYGTSATVARTAVIKLVCVHGNEWEHIENDNYNVVLEYIEQKMKEHENAKVMKREKFGDEEVDKVQEIPPKGYLRRHNKEGDQPSTSRNFHQIEANGLNATIQKQVIVLDSDDELDEENLVPKKRLWKSMNMTEESVQPCPFKRPKNGEHIESGDKQPEIKVIALPAINQDLSPGILCDLSSSAGKGTNVKVKGSMLESEPQYERGGCSNKSETSEIDIVSSDNGAVKICLEYNSSRKANLDKPDIKTVMKEVENEYRKHFGITDPAFSVVKLIEDICKRFAETATDDDKSEYMTPIPNDQENGMFGNGSEPSNSSKLKGIMKHPTYLQDITQGRENVQIPLLNDKDDMELPRFTYISKNMAFKDANVTFSLARISDDNCCSDCLGDCLLSSELPCACAAESRGEFAYTHEGLLKESFLDEAVAMCQSPQKHQLFYCKDCPLENRHKRNKRKRPCKGHLMRKFIKECWNRCGCNKKKCNNRIVQRGITATLEVFITAEGKGWGLRTVKALRKGEFVCEYVGEIVTNQELDLRNKSRSNKEEHTYPILLDADWGSEFFLGDEEALCLDATKFGNCARFINHRCVDANLVEIPVEVETPDHHYYHV